MLDNNENQISGELWLDFSPVSLLCWRKLFQKIRRSTLPQSYDYAVAVRRAEYQFPVWGLIKVEGQVVGLFQGFEAKLLSRCFHTIILDRGPLWLEGFGKPGQVTDFWEAFNSHYPRRFGRRRRFIPETSGNISFLTQQHHVKPYHTIWYDLTPDIEILRGRLRRNWRGHLKTAEHNQNLNVYFDRRGDKAEWLLHVYEMDRRIRGYRGSDVHLTRALIKSFAAGDGMAIGWVEDCGTPVAAILLLYHGSCATWQIGWVAERGRATQANYILLWEAIKMLKGCGIGALDLGGMNDENAKGIHDFKAGLNGETHILCGQYA